MAKGQSIHIGINHVDPDHYQGWSGDLVACEFDARDMEALAASRGFTDRRVLLSEEATSEAVVDAINTAAGSLESGDILLLTYSGHGGQVPDANDGDEPDRRDETWVLFDRQLVDDELYDLYARFAAGVRIVVLSDSCHSGSVTKFLPDFLQPQALEDRFGGTDPDTIVKRVRVLPERVARSTYEAHKKVYDDIQRSLPAGDDVEPAASILLISGCQDNQTSADGDRNGLFTKNLLEVWAGGAFKGSYRRFHQAIVDRMPPDQSPNLLMVGVPNLPFRRQGPFTV